MAYEASPEFADRAAESVAEDRLSERGDAAESLLASARAEAQAAGLGWAGQLTPAEAWQVIQAGAAVLVDVRTGEERKFVGHVPDSLHVAWALGTALTRNPRFVRELDARAGREQPLLLLCRSGKRSALAAKAAADAGFAHVFNVLEGFEGDLDDQQRRGLYNGWRYRGLPWVQD